MSGRNITLEQSRIENENHIRKLHPKHRAIFADFVKKCETSGIPVLIFSSFRSFQKQSELYRAYKSGDSKIKAAPPGRSLHEFGLAIDIYVYDYNKKTFTKDIAKYRRIANIATSVGLRWGGNFSEKNENHHFDYDAYNRNDLITLRKKNLLDSFGFVLLDKIQQTKQDSVSKIQETYNTEIGENITSEEEVNEKIKEENLRTVVSRVEEMNASGIWQIIKLVADQYSLSQNINDATIAFNQGSIFNFIQNVVQEPWLEFWGDTIGDQYYFNVRKQPFDYNGFTNLPSQEVIETMQVLSDDLNWYDGPIFSWYQIIPRGSFLGEQNLIFAYVTAVFFQEYAEIWGSKPNMQVSNYINFIKNQGKSTLFEKALEDLRYMVESNMYLPFTRQGTIVINGKSSIRRGYKIRYLPTDEIFYVDSVSNRYSIGENGPEYTTILKVSRGMKYNYTIAPLDSTTKSYFNIISFEKQKPIKKKELVKIKGGGGVQIFFDNDRPYIIDLSENFANSRRPADIKMVKQIKKFPNLRNQLVDVNKKMLSLATEVIENNPKCPKFVITGHIDSDNKVGSRWLSEKRAITFKNLIIDSYLKKYSTFSKQQLNDKIKTFANYNADTYSPVEGVDEANKILYEDNVEDALKIKAYSRYSEFVVEEYEYEVEKEYPSDEIGWHVNREVFQFFLNRLQNGK